MKTVVCTNTRNYNLTEGNEYRTRQENDAAEMYTVINDRGLERNYSAELFRDLVTTSTVEEIMATLAITVVNDGRELSLNYTVDGERVNSRISRPSEDGSSISCGIRQMYGLNEVARDVSNNIEDREDLQEKMMEAIYEYVISNFGGCAIIVASTNENDTRFALTSVGLDDQAEAIQTVRIPNSGNDIRMWTILKSQD